MNYKVTVEGARMLRGPTVPYDALRVDPEHGIEFLYKGEVVSKIKTTVDLSKGSLTLAGLEGRQSLIRKRE